MATAVKLASGEALRGLAGAAIMIGVLALALAPHDPAPQIFAHQDKLEHAGAFALLAGLFGLGARRKAMAGAIVGLAAFAFSIEALQAILTTTRQLSISDVLASLMGLTLGAITADWLNTGLRWPSAKNPRG